MSKPSLPPLGPLVQNFFCQRLQAQQQVSSHTLASYRDTLRLLLAFVERQSGTLPVNKPSGIGTAKPSWASWITWKKSAVAKLAPATFVWRPCAPLCAMSHSRRPKRWP